MKNILKIINLKWFSLKIKTRLSIVISFLFILITGFFLTVIFLFIKNNYKELIFEHQQQLVKFAANDIDTEILKTQEYLIKISYLIPYNKINDESYMQDFLLNFPKNHPVIDIYFNRGLFLLSKTGKLIAEYPYISEVHGADLSSTEFFINTMKLHKPYISKPLMGIREPIKPIIHFAVPLMDKNNNIAAVLLGSITLDNDSIFKKISNIKVGKNGYFYIYNTERVIIYHPDQSRIMIKDMPYGINEIYNKAIDGFEGSMEIINPKGINFLTTVKKLKNVDWIIASNFPRNEVNAPLQKMLVYLILLLLAIGSICISSIWLLMSFQLKPLNKLKDAFSYMEKDLFTTEKIKTIAKDEIAEISNSFNNMLDKIQNWGNELNTVNEKLYKLSTTDFLTGLINRRQIESYLKNEIEIAKRYNLPLSLIILDIDNFKIINDKFGHKIGDDVIIKASEILTISTRSCDFIGRIGGEEFIIILPSTTLDNSYIVAERIRKKVEECIVNDKIKFTLSIGVGVYKGETMEQLINKIDSFLYEAKTTGRNKIIIEN